MNTRQVSKRALGNPKEEAMKRMREKEELANEKEEFENEKESSNSLIAPPKQVVDSSEEEEEEEEKDDKEEEEDEEKQFKQMVGDSLLEKQNALRRMFMDAIRIWLMRNYPADQEHLVKYGLPFIRYFPGIKDTEIYEKRDESIIGVFELYYSKEDFTLIPIRCVTSLTKDNIQGYKTRLTIGLERSKTRRQSPDGIDILLLKVMEYFREHLETTILMYMDLWRYYIDDGIGDAHPALSFGYKLGF